MAFSRLLAQAHFTFYLQLFIEQQKEIQQQNISKKTIIVLKTTLTLIPLKKKGLSLRIYEYYGLQILTFGAARTYIYVLHFCNEQPSAFLQNDQRRMYMQRFIETKDRSKKRFIPATTDVYICCKYFTRATNLFSPQQPSLFTENLKIKFCDFI